MVDGKGDPNTAQDYSDAVAALYGVAYTIKFMSRKRLARDYGVPPLEGLWSAEDPAAFENARKSEYQWTMMIMQPEWIADAMPNRPAKTIRTWSRRLLLPQRPRKSYRRCRRFALSGITKVDRCNFCTRDRTMTRRQNSNTFITNICRNIT